MTFILSVATPEAVYQVSDRRLTSLEGGTRGTLVADDVNKGTLVDGRMSFSYTGISKILGDDSDEWIAKSLYGEPTRDIQHVFNVIRDKATRDFAKMRHYPSTWLLHAFVGIGWAHYVGEPLAPMYVTISNAIGDDGRWAQEPSDQFRIELDRWPKKHGGYALAVAGVPLGNGEGYEIWRHMQQAFRKKSPPHILVLGKMIDAVRWMATRHKEVGRGVLAMCIPKSAALHSLRTGAGMMLTGGPPTDEAATFYHLPGNGTRLTAYGPNWAMGSAITTNLIVTYGAP